LGGAFDRGSLLAGEDGFISALRDARRSTRYLRLVEAPSGQASRPSRAELRFDTVRITAWVYAAYCLTLLPINALSNVDTLRLGGTVQLALICVVFAMAAWSTTRRARLGYYFCLLFSIAILPGLPVGTILGWNMLRALRQNRRQFWPNSPRPKWMSSAPSSGA
jgi:hypothetical protein